MPALAKVPIACVNAIVSLATIGACDISLINLFSDEPSCPNDVVTVGIFAPDLARLAIAFVIDITDCCILGASERSVASCFMAVPTPFRLLADILLTLAFESLVRLFMKFCRLPLLKLALLNVLIPSASGFKALLTVDILPASIFPRRSIPAASLLKSAFFTDCNCFMPSAKFFIPSPILLKLSPLSLLRFCRPVVSKMSFFERLPKADASLFICCSAFCAFADISIERLSISILSPHFAHNKRAIGYDPVSLLTLFL